MRIALAAEGTRGDVHPMLGLGEQLAARGHEIVICASPDFRPDAEARGFAFRPVGRSMRERVQGDAAALTRGHLRVLGAIGRWLDDCLRGQFEALPEATRDADLVVAAGVQAGAASAAELHGVPYRYVAYCPLLMPSEDHPPFLIPWRANSPRWNRWLWRATRFVHDRGMGRLLARERAALGLGPVRDVLGHLLGARPILAADAELAPIPRTDVDVVQVPCLHRSVGEPIPPKLESFLESGPAPVFLGFGSMADPEPAETTRRVLAALARVRCRALISEGWAGLGAEALPEGVMQVGRVDHAALFPRVATVVHHGGAGTTTLAARAGVPQVIVPHLLDQHYWAERVRALGLGPPPLPRTHLSAMRLAAHLDAVLANEFLAEGARQLGRRLERHRGSTEAADAVLEGP